MSDRIDNLKATILLITLIASIFVLIGAMVASEYLAAAAIIGIWVWAVFK